MITDEKDQLKWMNFIMQINVLNWETKEDYENLFFLIRTIEFFEKNEEWKELKNIIYKFPLENHGYLFADAGGNWKGFGWVDFIY